jgi:hypothetical protein
MPRAHAAPLGTLALAATLTIGALLVAPKAEAAPRPHADPDVRLVTHLGDVTSGSTT